MNSHSSPQRLYSVQSLCFSEHSRSHTTPTTAPVTHHFQPHPNPNPQMLNTAQSHYMGGEDVFPTAMHLEVDYMFLDGAAESEGGADQSDLALEAAKAKWKVCEAEKHLADCIIEHQVTLLNIWCRRAEVANFRLLTADLNVGRLHMEQKKSGILTFTHTEGTATTSGSSSRSTSWMEDVSAFRSAAQRLSIYLSRDKKPRMPHQLPMCLPNRDTSSLTVHEPERPPLDKLTAHTSSRPSGSQRPPFYLNGATSTLDRSAYEHKIPDVEPIKEKVDMTDRLEDIRKLMTKDKLDYHIVPSEDPHQSEYVAANHKCRSWISGFTGSAGQAIVSNTAAYSVTDSRYWLQACDELDSNWHLITAGAVDGPKDWIDWLAVCAISFISCLTLIGFCVISGLCQGFKYWYRRTHDTVSIRP
ncbi:hypothetical protein DEU56DRAFT_923925 [Suillus clintonianus]|uniref:uncharacterized protein n=1 Tax=Suillus clintonianus TaxID=1904413 RepID=UPI001B87663C|nr:uncharacterized protein DEU56DRAFT_923925 [Suillus clintonianus]KAG2123728.1 hypothetical protein DEU56DRAFT_923925 [Suillus clintonianus]